MGALLYGYDTGIISGALLQIRDDFKTGDTWDQIIAASMLLGAIIGALSCSRLSERIGRKKTLSLSPCQIVLGFAVGGATQTVAMYVAEFDPPRRHGRLVLTLRVGIDVGIVVSTIVGATEQISWRLDSIVQVEQEERSAGENRVWRGLLSQAWVRPALLVGCGVAAFT